MQQRSNRNIDVQYMSDGKLVVKAPFNSEFNSALNDNDIRRQFNKEHKVWVFHEDDADSVLKLLNDYYGTGYKNNIL